MTAPREMIHRQARRISDLHEENAIAGDRQERIQLGVARENVEGVKRQTNALMRCSANDFPGVTVIVYKPTPGQCFVANSHIVTGSEFTEFAEVIRRALDTPERVRRAVATDHQEIRP